MIPVTMTLEKIFPEKEQPGKRRGRAFTFIQVGTALVLTFLVIGYSIYIWENKKTKDLENVSVDTSGTSDAEASEPNLYLQVSDTRH